LAALYVVVALSPFLFKSWDLLDLDDRALRTA
jgi:hypothetical protein